MGFLKSIFTRKKSARPKDASGEDVTRRKVNHPIRSNGSTSAMPGAGEPLTKMKPRGSSRHSAQPMMQGTPMIPPDAASLFQAAEAALRAKRWSEAARKYEQAFALYEPVAEAWCDYGLAMNNVGRIQDAERAFRKAIALKPTLANAYDNLGVLLVRDLNRPDEAEKLFLKALEIDPSHNARKNLEVLRKQRTGARVSRPEDERLPYEKEQEADRYEAQGRLREALSIYQQYLESQPRSVMALNNASTLYLQLRQFEQARNLLEKVVQLKPDYVKAWNNLGSLRMQLGDSPGAEKAFRKVLQLDSSNSIAQKGLQMLAMGGLSRMAGTPKPQGPLVCASCGGRFSDHGQWSPDNRAIGGARCPACGSFYCQPCVERARGVFSCSCGRAKTTLTDLGNFEEMVVFRTPG